MAIKPEELKKAHDILREFEKKDIHHSEFGWDYITERVNASRTSLWRNNDFNDEFKRIKKLIKVYSKKQQAFDHGMLKKSHGDAKISKLNQEIEDLKAQLDRERERLAYAAVIFRQKGFDASEFMDSSPINPGIVEKL